MSARVEGRERWRGSRTSSSGLGGRDGQETERTHHCWEKREKDKEDGDSFVAPSSVMQGLDAAALSTFWIEMMY